MVQQITAIAFRLLALWLLIQILLNLPSLLMFTSYLEQQNDNNTFFLHLGLITFFVLISLITVYFINQAVTSVLKKTQEKTDKTLNQDSQKLLFQLAGLYFFVDALSVLPRFLPFLQPHVDITVMSFAPSMGLVAQLLIGIWLMTHTTFWENSFRKLRGRA